MGKLTISSILRNSIQNRGDKIAMTFVGEEGLSYKELGNRIEYLAGLLNHYGIQKGDRVAVLGENMPNWGVGYLSVIYFGAVVVPVLPDFNESEVSTILVHSGSKAVFVSEKHYNRLSSLFTKLPIPVISLETLNIYGKGETMDASIKPIECIAVSEETIQEDELAALIYTSGTTGSSKGVMLTHKNIAWMVKVSRDIPDIVESDRFLSILPMSHTYENSLGFLLPLYAGSTIYYLRKQPTSAVLLEAFTAIKPTIFLTVPLIIEKIYRKQVIPKMNSKWITRNLFKFVPTRILLNRVAGK